MRKKILVLEPYLDLLGGSERMAFEVAKGLAKDGWEIYLGYDRDGIWKLKYQSFVKKIIKTPPPTLVVRNTWDILKTTFQIHKIIKTYGMTKVLTSCIAYLYSLALLGRFFGIQSYFHLGLSSTVLSSGCAKWAVRKISCGVAPSRHTADSWRTFGWPVEKLEVVPNWIDWEDYSKLPTKEEARKILERDSGVKGLSQRGKLKVVAFVGRLVEEKGIEALLKAWRMGLAENPDTVLIIVGQGKSEYETKLKGMAAGNVRFLGQMEDPRMVYRASDVTVVPSIIEESFGLIPLEAVACGSLPLVSQKGFLPEIVNGVHANLSFDVNSCHELTNLLGKYLLNDNQKTISDLRFHLRERFSAMQGISSYKKIIIG